MMFLTKESTKQVNLQDFVLCDLVITAFCRQTKKNNR
ncbi:MAG: hypothetical protein RIQ94_255 [Pseudomonadota bacterium]|jgi:hypothetical protein